MDDSESLTASDFEILTKENFFESITDAMLLTQRS